MEMGGREVVDGCECQWMSVDVTGWLKVLALQLKTTGGWVLPKTGEPGLNIEKNQKVKLFAFWFRF